ncbi:MAG: amidohydrolase family protein [Candidatus Cloacimonetes bacterium]|jgi:guanine deaminase|nr:amidohydrolase family protein [Candidatus Cloacimonadota bacterium]MDD4147340.1 amidohydrolase family protein [Candidatus Cloacimonadota bacterium]
MRNIRTNIFNPVSADIADFLPDHVISFEDSIISAVVPFNKFSGSWEDKRDRICLPGLIDLHVHLSQYRIRGLYHPALLPWLEQSVFPEEERSRNPFYAETLSRDFFHALINAGTTYSIIYTAPYRESAQIAFEVAQQMGIRAKIGMTMMNMNAPEALLQSTDYAIKHSIELFEKWHDQSLQYIFTPRFAPTCSATLMHEIGKFAHDNDAFIQTHLSENPEEIAWVKKIFGRNSYTEIYAKHGILGKKTILGHAIHLADAELDILKESGSSIAHCPDSNFYLKSGEYPLRRIDNHHIPFGLGSDVGAGTSLNMLYHAKMMNYRQTSDPIIPEEMLYRITLGSAKIAGMDNAIGSLEQGKDADMVFYRVPSGFDISEQSLGQLCFSPDSFAISEVLVLGKDMLSSS